MFIGVETMKIALLLCCGLAIVSVLLLPSAQCQNYDGADDNDENNDFAEFEEFDADDGFVPATDAKVNKVPAPAKVDGAAGGAAVVADEFQDIYDEGDEDDGIVEEESEFEHFHDEEEFEGFAKTESAPVPNVDAGEPKLTMAKVPLHFR